MSVTDARRELSKHIRGDTNWRLAGLFMAHPDVPSGHSERELAKAWPVHKSDYRRLGAHLRPEYDVGSPDAHYAASEDSDTYRQLSDATEASDWEDDSFGDKLIAKDRAIKRTLAFEDSIANLDTLFRQELRETVIQGAQKNQIARDAANVVNVDRSKGDHPRGPDDKFAPLVSEGGAIEDDAGKHDTVEWDAQKRGIGAAITDELIDQAIVDVMAQQVEHLGRAGENAINRVWLNELVDNAGETVDAGNTDNRGWAAINRAIGDIEANDFEPDSAAMHPEFFTNLLNTAENNTLIPFAQQFGDDEPIRDRVIFPLLGLEGFRGSGGVYEGTATWDYDGDGEEGAVVYDRDICNLYIYRDIEVKEYDDPIRDLQGVNVRLQVDCTLGQPDAAAVIDHGS